MSYNDKDTNLFSQVDPRSSSLEIVININFLNLISIDFVVLMVLLIFLLYFEASSMVT